jgi:S1-C subfamily serine protease
MTMSLREAPTPAPRPGIRWIAANVAAAVAMMVLVACAPPRTVGLSASAPARPVATRRLGPDATASGFVVSTAGDVMTNRHVVNRCQAIAVRTDSATTAPARIVALHARDDLAVIRSDLLFGEAASFRVGSRIRPGDDVVAVGFPLAGLLADEPSVTTGSVNALAGIHNDQSLLQMSAPVQQGSSGGPLFDASGNVVGVVVTKLNARVVAEETGDLPQNVNFAVKGDIARDFLRDVGVHVRADSSTTRKSNADVGDIGRRVTVMVECYR